MKRFDYYKLRHFCRYAVIDVETSVVLSVGEKYKYIIDLQYVDSFRLKPFFGRRLYQYVRFVNVLGRKCVIVYWFGHKAKEPWNTVMPAGAFLGMRGRTVARFVKNLYMRKFIDLLSKKLIKFMKNEYRKLEKASLELKYFCGSEEEFRYSIRIFRLNFQRYMRVYDRLITDFEMEPSCFIRPLPSIMERFILDDGVVRRNNEI